MDLDDDISPLKLGRLKWRCRRGMRELDKVTEGYLDEFYVAASAQERAAFERLLELPDPQLLALMFKHETAEDSIMEDVLAKMRQR
ncbi:MAG: succinate dehydrogenase assembly factor 2 [Gammaproteobacteria bacterium]